MENKTPCLDCETPRTCTINQKCDFEKKVEPLDISKNKFLTFLESKLTKTEFEKSEKSILIYEFEGKVFVKSKGNITEVSQMIFSQIKGNDFLLAVWLHTSILRTEFLNEKSFAQNGKK